MINYISTQPGTGKTHFMISEVLKTFNNVKHLIVQPTMKLQEETFNALSLIQDHVKVINTDTKNGNLLKDIRTALHDRNVTVLLITESMFYMLEPYELLQFQIWMDDCIQFSSNFFTGFSITDYDKWSNIFSTEIFEVVKNINADFDEVQIKELRYDMSDETIKIINNVKLKMRGYNKLGLNKDYINNPPASEKQKRFLTLVGWHDLSVYTNHKITFMANDFDSSLLYKYNSQHFQLVPFNGKQNINTNRLDVRYFVPSTSLKFGLTKSYTESKEGIQLIAKAVNYVNNNTEQFYCTENIDCPELAGEYYSPNLRGVNTLMHYSTALFFSCMNATPNEIRAYNKLFGFTALDIKTERELSVLYQFIARGIIRRRDVNDIMTVYVLTEDQALYLSNNPTYIDVSIVHKTTNKGGQKKKLSKDEKNSWNAFKGRCTRGKKATGFTDEKFAEFIEDNSFSQEVIDFLTQQHSVLKEEQNQQK